VERSADFWAEVEEEHGSEVELFSLSQEGQLTESGATMGKGPIWLQDTTHTKLNVGLLGLGTVGSGVVQWLQAFPHRFEISGIAVQSLDKKRPSWLPANLLTDDPWKVLEQQPDLVIEVMGGLEPSFALLQSALERGISVVSANKDLLALRGEYLQEIAFRSGALLLHSAAVGGSVPMLEISESLVDSEEILQVEGILNGTTNFVLGRMEEGFSAKEAVRLAQEAGFAEADPSSDLKGLDAAYKVSLLAEAAFGTALSVELIDCEGIENISLEEVQDALEVGECYRLVASCCRRGAWLEASVRPVRIPLEHPFAKVRDEHNLVQWGLSDNRCFFSHGKGAGRWPTALAVMGDIVEIWEDERARNRLEGRSQRPRQRCA
jgi:homoserine dehydrogenase